MTGAPSREKQCKTFELSANSISIVSNARQLSLTVKMGYVCEANFGTHLT